MSLLEAEEYAKDNDQYSSGKFIAEFPAGDMACTWLDAYFGLFRIDGHEGFVSVRDMRNHLPNLRVRLVS
ncbi:TPA: hypothetical protein QEL68_000740 [Stenotrophomonas maltophilia]|nr:hypothetical protein [Stenotrophomonas maltophilia]